jgi:hypothetical protein
MTTTGTSTQPSEPLFSRSFLASVTLASGAGQVVDFALPLFAGAVLDPTAVQTGAMLAAGLATSFLLRPLLGIAPSGRYDEEVDHAIMRWNCPADGWAPSPVGGSR